MNFNEIVQQFQHSVFGNLTTIRSFKDKNKIWFLGAEIQELLGFVNLTQVIKDANLNSNEKFILTKATNNKFFNQLINQSLTRIGKYSSATTLISRSGLIKIIANSQKIINKEDVLCDFGLNEFIILKTRKEVEFGLLLKNFCKELKIKIIFQYTLNNKKIDFYFPDFSLGLEFDEDYHKSINQKIKDNVRETFIKNQKKIKIIRINENLDELISVLLTLVKHKYEK